TTSTGCIAEHTMTVIATPSISGSSVICTGSTITLTGAPTGGTWSAGDSSVAAVSASGGVSGLSSGVTNIYYTLHGCSASHAVTVAATPSISGSSIACTGSTIVLTGSPSGGTWSAGGSGIATVSASGVVTGLSAGVTYIYYTIGSCSAHHAVTVNAGASI